jgi:hypothetical protein
MKNRKFWVSVMAGILAGVMILSLIFSILPMPVDAKTSDEIRDEIDQLETTRIEAIAYDRWEEHFSLLLVVSALLMLVAVSLSMAATRRMA